MKKQDLDVKVALFLLNMRSAVIIIIIYHAEIKVSEEIISTSPIY